MMDITTSEFWLAPKQDSSVIGVAHIPPQPRTCGNCKWFEFVYKGRGVCNNPRIEEYLDQTLDYTREDFGCVPLWEAKESEGGET